MKKKSFYIIFQLFTIFDIFFSKFYIEIDGMKILIKKIASITYDPTLN